MQLVVISLALLVANAAAVPIDHNGGEIPVQIVLAESGPALEPKALPVEDVKVEVDEEKKENEPREVVKPSAVIEESKEAGIKQEETVEKKSASVEVPSEDVAKEKSADDLTTDTEKDPKGVKTESEDKDMETQASAWGGWATPVAAAWPVAAWPATSYYYPTAHYSHSYWPSYTAPGWW